MLQYFGHLIRRADSLEKTLMLGKTEVKRTRGQQRMRWSDGITDSMERSLSALRRWCRQKAWSAAVHGVEELDTTEQPSNNLGDSNKDNRQKQGCLGGSGCFHGDKQRSGEHPHSAPSATVGAQGSPFRNRASSKEAPKAPRWGQLEAVEHLRRARHD